jgi:hypothetical protein
MNVRMRVLVRMGVLMFMRVDRAIGMPMLVGVAVRVDVRMDVLVFDFSGHRMVLLISGKGCLCPNSSRKFYAQCLPWANGSGDWPVILDGWTAQGNMAFEWGTLQASTGNGIIVESKRNVNSRRKETPQESKIT